MNIDKKTMAGLLAMLGAGSPALGDINNIIAPDQTTPSMEQLEVNGLAGKPLDFFLLQRAFLGDLLVEHGLYSRDSAASYVVSLSDEETVNLVNTLIDDRVSAALRAGVPTESK